MPVPPDNRVASWIGQGMGMLLAIFCVAITASLLYDVAYQAHSPNDWGDPANTDLFFIWVINVPGWIVAMCLATFVGRVRRFPAIVTYVLFAVELVLLGLVPTAFRMLHERREKQREEITQQAEKDAQQYIEEMRKASPAVTPPPTP